MVEMAKIKNNVEFSIKK